MAEVIFKTLLKRNNQQGFEIASAGTYSLPGLPMTPTAKDALFLRGWDIAEASKSTLFNFDMLDEYDHIITMTQRHKDAIGHYPNVKTLSDFVGGGDVQDPFMSPLEYYLKTCEDLEIRIQDLYQVLMEENKR